MSAREILADVILDESGNSPNGIADRILADKRIAVVELPEATRIDTYGVDHYWVDRFEIEQDVDLVTLTHRDRAYWREINADTARNLAAALLAAANAAEATR